MNGDGLNRYLTDERLGKNGQAKIDTLLYLQCRWMDEAEYEEWSEYEDLAKNTINSEAWELRKMTKGFVFDIVHKPSNRLFRLRIGGTGYSIGELELKSA